jgi:hypothetical protein
MTKTFFVSRLPKSRAEAAVNFHGGTNDRGGESSQRMFIPHAFHLRVSVVRSFPDRLALLKERSDALAEVVALADAGILLDRIGNQAVQFFLCRLR